MGGWPYNPKTVDSLKVPKKERVQRGKDCKKGGWKRTREKQHHGGGRERFFSPTQKKRGEVKKKRSGGGLKETDIRATSRRGAS